MAKQNQWVEINLEGTPVGNTTWEVSIFKIEPPESGNAAQVLLLNVGDQKGSTTIHEEDSEITEVAARWAKAHGLNASDLEREIRSQFETGRAMMLEEERSEEKASETQSTMLISYAHEAPITLFKTEEGDAYASVPIDGHVETHPLRSKGFRLWLGRQFFLANNKKTPGTQAVQDAIDALEGEALFGNCAQEEVRVRVAEQNGKIYLDLCDEAWRTVEVDAEGWRIVEKSPVKFRRSRGMMALPTPVSSGSIDALKDFINLNWESDEDWILLVSWLTMAMRPKGPYPVLVLFGEQGSAKSSLARALRALFDPNKAGLRRPPRNEHDIPIAAKNSHVVALDNLTRLPDWLSDALCTLATGGGFATRRLFTDDEEAIFEAQRPIILNGITEFASRADLVDRSVILQLQQIDEKARRDETTLHSEFDAALPQILGALLTKQGTRKPYNK